MVELEQDELREFHKLLPVIFPHGTSTEDISAIKGVMSSSPFPGQVDERHVGTTAGVSAFSDFTDISESQTPDPGRHKQEVYWLCRFFVLFG